MHAKGDMQLRAWPAYGAPLGQEGACVPPCCWQASPRRTDAPHIATCACLQLADNMQLLSAKEELQSKLEMAQARLQVGLRVSGFRSRSLRSSVLDKAAALRPRHQPQYTPVQLPGMPHSKACRLACAA